MTRLQICHPWLTSDTESQLFTAAPDIGCSLIKRMPAGNLIKPIMDVTAEGQVMDAFTTRMNGDRAVLGGGLAIQYAPRRP